MMYTVDAEELIKNYGDLPIRISHDPINLNPIVYVGVPECYKDNEGNWINDYVWHRLRG